MWWHPPFSRPAVYCIVTKGAAVGRSTGGARASETQSKLLSMRRRTHINTEHDTPHDLMVVNIMSGGHFNGHGTTIFS